MVAYRGDFEDYKIDINRRIFIWKEHVEEHEAR
jgi:hypothetical protein